MVLSWSMGQIMAKGQARHGRDWMTPACRECQPPPRLLPNRRDVFSITPCLPPRLVRGFSSVAAASSQSFGGIVSLQTDEDEVLLLGSEEAFLLLTELKSDN